MDTWERDLISQSFGPGTTTSEENGTSENFLPNALTSKVYRSSHQPWIWLKLPLVRHGTGTLGRGNAGNSEWQQNYDAIATIPRFSCGQTVLTFSVIATTRTRYELARKRSKALLLRSKTSRS